MTMKQMIVGLALAGLLYSCDKEEPILRPQTTEEKVDTTEDAKKNDSNDKDSDRGSDNSNSDQSNNGESNNSDNNSNNVSDRGNENTNENTASNDDKKTNEAEQAQPATLTEAEVISYFSLEKSQTVAQASERIGQVRGTKQIGTKTVTIEDADFNLEEEFGRLTVRLKGRVGRQPLEQLILLEGFVKKPDAYTIGSRMQVRWKVSQERYLDYIDLDALYVDHDASKFTAKYLASVVEFYSTAVDGKPYYLTAEEAEAIEILEVRYRGESIELKTRYKGATSQNRLSLDFNRRAYYDRKVRVNNTPAAQWYMYGIAEDDNMALFLGDFLEYDDSKYAAVHTNTHLDNSGNAVSVEFKLMSRKDDRELAILQKTITGFKPLSDLAKDIFVASHYDLVEYFQARFKGLNGEQLKNRVASSLYTWIKKAGFYYAKPNVELEWVNIRVDGGSVAGLSGRDGSRGKMHLYFKNPRFEVVSVEQTDHRLNVKLKMTFVNEVALDNVFYTLSVPM